MRWLEAAIAGLLDGFPLALLAIAVGLGARLAGRSSGRDRAGELALGAWGVAGAIVAHGLSETTGLGPLANGVAVVPAAFGGAYLLHALVLGRPAIVGDPVRPLLAAVLLVVGAAAGFEVLRGLEPVGGTVGERVIELWEGPQLVVEQGVSAAVALGGLVIVAIVTTGTRLALRARTALSSEDLVAQGGHDPRAVAATVAAIAAAAGALAGITLSRGHAIAPPDALGVTVLGAEAAIIGGIGSVPGALVGGLALGLVRALGDEASSGWGPVLGHGLALLVLAARAAGASLANPPSKERRGDDGGQHDTVHAAQPLHAASAVRAGRRRRDRPRPLARSRSAAGRRRPSWRRRPPTTGQPRRGSGSTRPRRRSFRPIPCCR